MALCARFRERSQNDTIRRVKIYAWGGDQGYLGLRLLRIGQQRSDPVGVRCTLSGTRPSRHAVRLAGVDHSRELPCEPSLHRRGPGLSTLSTIAGEPATLMATWLIHQFGIGHAVSVYILVSAVITHIALKFLNDRLRSDISDDESYSRKSFR